MDAEHQRQVVGDYVIDAQAVRCDDGSYRAHVGVSKVHEPYWRILDWHATAIAFDSDVDAREAGIAAGRRWLSGGGCE